MASVSSGMGGTAATITLEPSDIPGALLEEPFEAHAMPALRWWLLCRGIKAPVSWKKKQLITRIHEAIEDKVAVLDVDGSRTYLKHKKLTDSGVSIAPLEQPTCAPLSGWQGITDSNVRVMAEKMPRVTSGTVYVYLASGAGRDGMQEGTFRALTRGYTHWASGRISQIEVNLENPMYCHVRSTMTPSMKQGNYHLWLLLGRDGDFATVLSATCECVAGLSASCTHISALLHALVAMTPTEFLQQPSASTSGDDNESLPCTSYPCQWKQPKKRKESNLRMGDAVFEKHVLGRECKRKVVAVEDFDPRPQKYRGTVNERVPILLDKIRGEGLCISLLLDPKVRHWDNSLTATPSISTASLPKQRSLTDTIAAFKDSLKLSEEKLREIEFNTRKQRQSNQWFEVRRYRLTSSLFGHILRRRSDTPPDSLVLRILQPKQFSTPATSWGITHEPLAITEYTKNQHEHGHDGLIVAPSGFLISKTHPFLGASPDGSVYDPSNRSRPFGFLEVKCPFSHRNVTPEEACQDKQFCCAVQEDADGTKQVVLKRDHPYFAQIQGQMAIGERPWCDFVVYTTQGLSVHRVLFDSDYWENILLPKLVSFYDNCIAPEIVSPIHTLGLPLRDLSK